MSSNSPTEKPGAVKRPRWRIWLVRAVFAGAVFVTLIFAFFLVERARGQSVWKTYVADARSRNVKLTIAEFVPPPVPDERNFAAVPIFQDTFRTPRPPDPFALPKDGGARQPPFSSLSKNQPPDLEAWRKFFIDTKMLPAAGEDAASDVLRALESYAPQWDQLRTAAARPEARFPVRYDDGPGAALPHLGVFQSAARLNVLRMAAHLARGESAAAYEDFRLGLRLCTALEKEPTLIAGLIRLNALGILESGTWAGLAQRHWAAPELEKLTADLARLRLIDDYAFAIGSERGFCNLLHERLLWKGTGELASLIAMTHEDGTTTNTRKAGAVYGLYPTGWVRLSQTRSNRYFDAMLAHVSQDPPRVDSEPSAESLLADKASAGMLERARYLMFFISVPALSEVKRSYAYMQTLTDETRVACALERHRLTTGSFPASLDPLVPGLLPALPRDVMTGEPLHYRLSADGGGYVIYSVGWNLQDDGGKSEGESSPKKQPDWVWTMLGK